jgi:hypothetical protein
MASESGLGWLPDRAPTWIDVLAGAFAVVLFLSNASEIARPNRIWAVGGFLVAAALLGPVGRSSLVGRASGWSWIAERVVFYALVAVTVAVVWVVRRNLGFPPGALSALATGGFLAVTVFVTLHVLSRRAVEDW